MTVVSPIIDVQLSGGEVVPLASLYAEHPLVLVFLRHFGCPFCREHVAQLRLHPSLPIAFVGMGNLEQTAGFRAAMKSPHTFISDPDRVLYQAFGLGRGTGRQLMNPRTFARGFGATLRGHWVGAPIGDPWQMPGVFLINPNGEVSWEYRSVDASDNASVPDIQRQLLASGK